MVISDEVHTVELAYVGQEVAVTDTATSFYNERQKVNITLAKVMERNEAFGIGDNGEILKELVEMIGKRIRFIRKKRNMTMKYLGTAVGFPESSADIRISQYESETRTPKADLLRKIADVLDVSPDALAVPDLVSIAGIMHTLFIIEDIYRLRFRLIDSESAELNNAVKEWQRKYDSYTKGEISKESYDNWRYNFKEKSLS